MLVDTMFHIIIIYPSYIHIHVESITHTWGIFIYVCHRMRRSHPSSATLPTCTSCSKPRTLPSKSCPKMVLLKICKYIYMYIRIHIRISIKMIQIQNVRCNRWLFSSFNAGEWEQSEAMFSLDIAAQQLWSPTANLRVVLFNYSCQLAVCAA